MSSNKMKMRGFMCRTPASTAVCLPDDMRSVIVPRKSRSTADIDNEVRMVRSNVAKYSRIVDEGNKKRERKDHMMLPLGHHHRKLVDLHHDHHDHHQKQLQREKMKKQRANFQLHSVTPPSTHLFQVVVLRVSLHCQGCASKLKKHLSRMEGVTSFSIDLETRRVTVMGHVTPTGVLESISQVKRAEFWPC